MPRLQPPQDTHVAVIGLGYVGLPLALLAQENGYTVVGLDNNTDKVSAINRGVAPFYDPALHTKLQANSLSATTDTACLQTADIIIVCVPTPLDSNTKPDLKPLKAACQSIAENVRAGTLIIIESTVNPGVCDEIVIPLLENISGMKVGEDLFLAHCPERINPGDPRWDVSNIPRVIGAYDPRSLATAADFYRSIIAAPIHEMDSIIEAEAVKLTENSFRDVNIAFVNELAMSFDKLGINTKKVIDGAATKPFSFLAHYPGIGVGGHCIPVDPLYLIDYAAQNGFDHKILKLARHTNDNMPAYAIRLLEDGAATADLKDTSLRVGVLGLSYKENVGDLRESPALKVIDQLSNKHIEFRVHDPHVQLTTEHTQAQDLERLLKWANALIICTAHQEYMGLTENSLQDTDIKVVIDGRNCLNKHEFSDHGIVYHGVGVQ